MICLSFCNLCPAFAQVLPNDLKITNIANEGFLLTSSTHKVLIDALYSNGYGLFSVPPKEVREDIMNVRVPFDNVDLYLLTHYHQDHCDAVLINEYLSKYPKIPFVASQPSVVFIDGTCFGFIGKKKQFRVMTPEINKSISQTISNIPVKAFGLKHLSFIKDGIDLEETMFNVSYMIEMDGIKVFHSGDMEKNAFDDYLANNREWTDSVDVAFLYYGLLKSGESDLEYIMKTINPKQIILMHIPPASYEEWDAKIEQFRKKFQNIMFFKNSLASKTVTKISSLVTSQR
jgi:L-ascorbate metabolism protein UlaG (beta-lactamase superfamily)